MRTASWTWRIAIPLGISLVFFGYMLDDAWGQRGGGGRRGGGGTRARLTRQSPYADFPWEAQTLLEAHRQTLRSLPPPLRAYILTRVRQWETFFPAEENLFTAFFDKIAGIPQEARRKELRNAFRDAMPSSGQGGQRQRDPRPPAEPLDANQMDRIEAAFERYVLADQVLPTALIMVAFSGAGSPNGESPPPDGLVSQGALLKGIAFNGPPEAWMAELLTGCDDAVKGKSLRYPGLFEYHNKAGGEHTQTFAFHPGKNAPPSVSNQKGFGKKYAPLTVRASDLGNAAETIRSQVEKARQEDRSKQYINVMVKGKLTLQELKIDKIIKDNALGRLALSTLFASDEHLALGNAFLGGLSFACLQKAQPDLLLVHFTADNTAGEAGQFIQNVWSVLQKRFRYKGRAVLAVLHQPAGQALLLGAGVPAGVEMAGPHSLKDLSVTLSKLAGIEAAMSQGAPVDLFAGK